ncbi:hypothetical protein L7F22_053543 [Adiantum nelumboides]|nr:hypothetical protein [Adiantum nelumboides]
MPKEKEKKWRQVSEYRKPHQTQSSSTSGHCNFPPVSSPRVSTRADSLRALKQALSLRVGSQAGSLRAPLKLPMQCQQAMPFQALLPEEIQESSCIQVPQQGSEDTLKPPMKRLRFSLSFDAEKEECREAHCGKKIDKDQHVSTINRIEEIKMQSGLLKETAFLQAESVKAKSADLEKTVAVQENAQDLDDKEYSNVQYGPFQEALINFEVQASSKTAMEAVVVPPKAKRRHEKKAKKRPLAVKQQGQEL